MKQHKVLIVASVVSFIEWFNKENVVYIKKNKNCELHIACNFDYMEDTDEERTRKYIDKISSDGIVLHNIHFARSPFCSENIDCYKKLKAIIDENHFDLIHVHTPTVSILTRLAARKARKQGTVVMYTCHGFHFHNAGPKLNWLIFYPMERFMSRFCDYIVTINQEDYHRAQTFHAPFVRYIPGVGVDLSRIRHAADVDKATFRKSIGIPDDGVLVLSVGEMIPRKNHEVIIRAIAKTENTSIYFAICGKGPLKDELKQLATNLGIENRVKFLGFRTDIPQLCNVADISAFPSRIEGLGLAGIEAMAAGVPLVSSNVHGILDYVKDGVTGYARNPEDVDGFANAINKLAMDKNLKESMHDACIKAVEPFDINNALRTMWNIYDEILK